MSTFIFVVTVACAIELVCKLICMALDCVPQRTRGGMLVDALFGMGLLCWGVYLLAK